MPIPATSKYNCVSATALREPRLRESTGAPRSPKRTPDFLSSLLALANFTRLSLMKAAHAGLGGRPVQEIRIRGPKTMGAAQRSLSLDYRQISICFHKSIDSCHGTVPQG